MSSIAYSEIELQLQPKIGRKINMGFWKEEWNKLDENGKKSIIKTFIPPIFLLIVIIILLLTINTIGKVFLSS